MFFVMLWGVRELRIIIIIIKCNVGGLKILIVFSSNVDVKVRGILKFCLFLKFNIGGGVILFLFF